MKNDGEEAFEELLQLVQFPNVKSYQRRFQEITAILNDLPEEFCVRCFTKGLREDIKFGVEMYKPTTMDQAIGLAKLQEMTLEVVAMRSDTRGTLLSINNPNTINATTTPLLSQIENIGGEKMEHRESTLPVQPIVCESAPMVGATYNKEIDELMELRQWSTVGEYRKQFLVVANKIEGLSEIFLISRFVCGLEEEIRAGVQPFQPYTLDQAMVLAMLQEMTVKAITKEDFGSSSAPFVHQSDLLPRKSRNEQRKNKYFGIVDSMPDEEARNAMEALNVKMTHKKDKRKELLKYECIETNSCHKNSEVSNTCVTNLDASTADWKPKQHLVIFGRVISKGVNCYNAGVRKYFGQQVTDGNKSKVISPISNKFKMGYLIKDKEIYFQKNFVSLADVSTNVCINWHQEKFSTCIHKIWDPGGFSANCLSGLISLWLSVLESLQSNPRCTFISRDDVKFFLLYVSHPEAVSSFKVNYSFLHNKRVLFNTDFERLALKGINVEGSQVMVWHGNPSYVKADECSIRHFTSEKFEGYCPLTIQAKYEGLMGDELAVNGGMESLKVIKIKNDLALSFVNDANATKQLKHYLSSVTSKSNRVLAKIESLESLLKLEEIVKACDWILAARDDLGVEILLEQIPVVLEKMIQVWRKLTKSMIIAYKKGLVQFKATFKPSPRFYGSYPVLQKIGAVTYKLDLPPSTRIHPVFDVLLLKKKLGTQVVPQSFLPAISEARTIESVSVTVLDCRLVKVKGRPATQLMIQWSNSFPEDATWEFYTSLKSKFPTCEPCGQGSSKGRGNDTHHNSDPAGISLLSTMPVQIGQEV